MLQNIFNTELQAKNHNHENLAGTTVQSLKEKSSTLNIVGGVLTIDCSLGNCFITTLNQNITQINFTNIPEDGVYSILLQFVATGTARTVAWPSVKWPAGAAPQLTSTNGKIDSFILLKVEQSSWYGFVAGLNS